MLDSKISDECLQVWAAKTEANYIAQNNIMFTST